MSSNKLIGRQREIAELQRCLMSDKSEFVIVYGRRRVANPESHSILQSQVVMDDLFFA